MRPPILIVLHQETSTPGRLGHALRQRGYPLDVRRPRFGDPLPETMAGHSGAITFGGPMSANDATDFIRREIDWLAVPLKEKKPFLGICLGAQMLAHHLGSRVYRHPDGHAEVGYYPIRPTDIGRMVCAAISSRRDPRHDVPVDDARPRTHAIAERQAAGGAFRRSRGLRSRRAGLARRVPQPLAGETGRAGGAGIDGLIKRVVFGYLAQHRH